MTSSNKTTEQATLALGTGGASGPDSVTIGDVVVAIYPDVGGTTYLKIAGLDGDEIISTSGRRARWDGAAWIIDGSEHEPAPTSGTIGVAQPSGTKYYEYTDGAGQPLYRKARVGRGRDKKMWTERYEDGRWIRGLGDVQRVLYNQAAVMAADTVVYVESELDADELIARGIDATTAGGSNGWQDEFAEVLAGKTLIVIPDNDEPGHKHAAQVADGLHGIAAEVKIVELPVGPGGDTSDYLDNGGTVEQLLALAAAAPNYSPPMAQDTGAMADGRDGRSTAVRGQSIVIPQGGGEIDTEQIKHSVDLLTLIPGGFEKVADTGGGEYAGPCPFCGGDDRFHIQPRHPELGGRWFCRRCHEQWGDAIDYVMLRDGCEFLEAAERLGGKVAPGQSANGSGPAVLTLGQVGEIAIPQPISGAEFAARVYEPRQFYIDGLMARGHFGVLGGRPKGGKSWLVLTKAMCIDTGREFLGRKTEPARVLLVLLEDSEQAINERLRALKWVPKRTDFLFDIARFDGPGGDPGPGLVQIAELAKQYDVIVGDTLIATFTGRADENSNPQMAAIGNELARIAHETNTAIWVTHHTGKGQSDDPFEKLRGASSLRGAYDVGLILERRQGEREAILYAESRDLDIDNMTLRQAANGAGWEYVGPGFQIENIRAGRKTMEAMLSHPEYLDGLTVAQIAEQRGVTEQATRAQLSILENAGHVRRESPTSTNSGKLPDLWFVADGYRG